MTLFRINDLQKNRLEVLNCHDVNWEDINMYFQYMTKADINNVDDLVSFVTEKGNAIFNHLRYSLQHNVVWNNNSDTIKYHKLSNDLRTGNMLYRYIWLCGNDKDITIIDRGNIWYEDEDLCRRVGNLYHPCLDYLESELSHIFISVESTPICTDQLICHKECNELLQTHNSSPNMNDSNNSIIAECVDSCLPDMKGTNVESEEFTIEEYIYDRICQEKSKKKWYMCWK